MKVIAAVKTCLRKYACFRGRAPRSEFWWFSFVALLAQGVVLISCLSLIRSLKSMPSWGGFQILAVTDALIAVLLQFVIFIPMLAVGIRRLHDSDLSGWWLPTAMWLPSLLALGCALLWGRPEALDMVKLVGGNSSLFPKILDGHPVLSWSLRILNMLLQFFLLFVWVRKGTSGPNRFGPDPLAPETAPGNPPVSPPAERKAAMSFARGIKTCLRKYLHVRGRASRAEFWWFVLLYALLLLGYKILLFRQQGPDWLFFVTQGLPLLALLLLAVPLLAVGVRRLHDSNLRCWWLLVPLVPTLLALGIGAWVGIPASLVWMEITDAALAYHLERYPGEFWILHLPTALLLLLLLCLCLRKGTSGPNRFGPDPLTVARERRI